MKWLKRKLRQWVREDEVYAVEAPALVAGSRGVDIDGLSFNVMSATGGTVVQVRYYDRKTDRHNYSTYLIHDEESIVERVGQIVALEILKS